jgi:hypothetical protein
VGIGGNWEQRRVEPVSRMGELDLRTCVRLGGASAAALIFGYGLFTESVWARPVSSDYPFSLGISRRYYSGLQTNLPSSKTAISDQLYLADR